MPRYTTRGRLIYESQKPGSGAAAGLYCLIFNDCKVGSRCITFENTIAGIELPKAEEVKPVNDGTCPCSMELILASGDEVSEDSPTDSSYDVYSSRHQFLTHAVDLPPIARPLDVI